MIMMGKGGMRRSAAIRNACKFKTTTVFHMKFIQGLHNSEQGITVVSECLTQSSIYLNSIFTVRPELKLTAVWAEQILWNL